MMTDNSSKSTVLTEIPLVSLLLTKENYPIWRSMFISVLRAADMLDLTEDGVVQCPPQTETLDYADWIKRDQVFLTWINHSLTLSLLASTKEFTSGRALWFHLESQVGEEHMTYVRRLRARLANLDFASNKKEYLEKAKQISNALAKAGSPVDDSELVPFVLKGLPKCYEDFVTDIRDRSEPVTFERLEELLESYTTPNEDVEMFSVMIVALWFVAILLLVVGALSLKTFFVYTVGSVVVLVGLNVASDLAHVRREERRSAEKYKRLLKEFEEYKKVKEV